MKKRIAALLLALVMVFSIFPMQAFAAETETIAAGQQKTITLNADETATYTFTPTESGEYTMWNTGDTPYFATIYDYNSFCIFNGNAPAAFVAEAGKSYEINIINFESNHATLTYQIHLEKSVPMVSFDFENGNTAMLVVGDRMSFPLSFEPFNSIRGDVTWSLSDESVATIVNRFNGGCDVKGLAAGKTTLTVTANGQTAACEITVEEPIVFTADEVKYVTVDPGSYVMCTFTPTETSEYTLWNVGENTYQGYHVSVIDYNSWCFFNGNMPCPFTAEAGKTYKIRINNYWDTPQTFEVHLEKNVPLISVTPRMSEVIILQGMTKEIPLAYDPVNAIRGDVTWTLSDDTVASIPSSFTDMCRVTGEKAGKTTLTAKVGDQSVSVEITVLAPETISDGDKKVVTLEPGTDAAFTFTAPESGEYLFWNEGLHEYWFTAYDESGRQINNGNADYNFNANAGSTYTIVVHNYHDEDAEFSLYLEKCVPLKKAYFYYEEVTMYLGETRSNPLIFDPINAIRGEVSWSLSDESVAAITNSFSGGCDVRADKLGTTTLTAKSDYFTVSRKITVLCPHEQVNDHKCDNCGETLPCTDGDGNNLCDFCGADMSPAENPFEDMPETAYYYEPVLWAVEKGITSGKTDTAFEPGEDCTRAQIVTFLWRAVGCPEPETSENPFVDVKESAYYYKAVLWAVESGITSGKDATHFAPGDACTRAQVATFLWRSVGSPKPESSENPFVDVISGKYYYDAVLWAVENSITAGKTATEFQPNATCTRAQIVTFLHRMMVEQGIELEVG